MEAAWPGQQRGLRDHCASGLYILTLLLHGYGFSEHTWPSLEFRKQVQPPGLGRAGWAPRQLAAALTAVYPQAGDADIGWTLGYMLNLTSMIPARAPTQGRAQSCSVWAAGVVFTVLTLMAVLAATVAHILWHRERPGSHSTGHPQP